MSKLFPISNGTLMLLRPSFLSNSCLRNGTSATLPDFSDLTRLLFPARRAAEVTRPLGSERKAAMPLGT